jgi:uncharacterized membrane-anchored protein YjiN (DUF445 family)
MNNLQSLVLVVNHLSQSVNRLEADVQELLTSSTSSQSSSATDSEPATKNEVKLTVDDVRRIIADQLAAQLTEIDVRRIVSEVTAQSIDETRVRDIVKSAVDEVFGALSQSLPAIDANALENAVAGTNSEAPKKARPSRSKAAIAARQAAKAAASVSGSDDIDASLDVNGPLGSNSPEIAVSID